MVEKQLISQQRTRRTTTPTEKPQKNNRMYLQRKQGIRSLSHNKNIQGDEVLTHFNFAVRLPSHGPV